VQSFAAYYRAWKPLLEKAYRELGGKGTFQQRLHAALDRVEAVHSLTAQPELVQPVVYYKYADPTLESASDVEKLMWRLGPRNTQKVQDYLHRLEPEL
jgi:PHD/YefM family antitoxin component YafN of YafNO toxin-antitoxin module